MKSFVDVEDSVLRERLAPNNRTHLGVGPMSLNCVDATIELANEFDVPLMLIASRRQIECLELGGGYVNNWDTMSFARYVKSKDIAGKVILARDHGGPWQHPNEVTRYPNIDDAMESAKISYLRDIEAGFQIIHIDPVIYLEEEPSLEWILDKVFELYAYCVEIAHSLNRKILIELGTEEQKKNPLKNIEALEQLLARIHGFCTERKFPQPTYIVVQTGTKVMGVENIGDFPSEESEIPSYIERHQLRDIVDLCNKYGVMLKQHNTDYLVNTSLEFHPSIGVHAANVAPEFGVMETRAFLDLLQRLEMEPERAEFIDLCVRSKKWVKWLEKDRVYSDLEKTWISGHYNFSDSTFHEIKQKVALKLMKSGETVDGLLKRAVKDSIFRYMKCFNLVSQ